jgi:hypothetical protein
MKAVVWSKPACPCDKAKNLLKNKGIEYEEKNIAEGYKIRGPTGTGAQRKDHATDLAGRRTHGWVRSARSKTQGDKMIQQALIKKLEGDIEVAKADLRVFLANPIGVAEHIDYVITAEKKLEALAHAEDKLQSLKNL